MQNKPGYTRGEQWIRVNKDFMLLDTPGILWPKLDQEITALNLASLSAIKEEILPIDIGYYLYNNTDQFNKNYKGASGKAIIYASQHYGITYKNIYTKEQLIEELEKGNIIYASMQNGKFATPYWNHAILIYDYSNDKVRTIASDPLNSNNNGWVDIDLIWNQKNTDPDDLTGGSALYSLS